MERERRSEDITLGYIPVHTTFDVLLPFLRGETTGRDCVFGTNKVL
jgi:hypothetical protein